MTELTYKIGTFNAVTRTVPVTFTSGEIEHKRDVNAVLKDDGTYDKAGTKARVEDVARGVAHKIGLGVITVPQPEPELVATPETPAEEA